MKVVIWGIGQNWKNIKSYINYQSNEIVALVDSYSKEQGVFEPDTFFSKECGYDVVLITVSCYDEIKRQLMEKYGVDEEKIAVFELEDALTKMLVRDEFFFRKNIEQKVWNIYKEQERMLYLQGQILCEEYMKRNVIQSIQEVEFRVSSQWGEDGILQWLINHIPIKNKTFIEFGVENYEEANTRFLLQHDNWSGMIIDASKKNMDYVKSDEIYWRYDLLAKEAFITKDNINELLKESGFDSDLGLLSIDIDGNDYWILNEIECMKPRILICEYNALFGEREKVTIPYNDNFYRTDAHYSNLYYGASLEAIKALAYEKGYYFVGSNSGGCNAFFVRSDLQKYVDETIIKKKFFTKSKFREARDENHKLTYLSAEKAKKIIADMEVWDIDGFAKTIKELK